MTFAAAGLDRHTARWKSYLKDCGNVLDFVEPMQVSGRVTRVAGLVMECVGLKLAVGSACTIPVASGARIEAEVVGFEGERLFLMPQSDVEGVVPGSRVFPVEPSVPKPGSVHLHHPDPGPGTGLGDVLDDDGTGPSQPVDPGGPHARTSV